MVQEFVGKNHDPRALLVTDVKTAQELLRLTHLTIKKVTRDIEDEKFNTAVASMMEMVNGLYKIKESHGIDMSDEWRFALESFDSDFGAFCSAYHRGIVA